MKWIILLGLVALAAGVTVVGIPAALSKEQLIALAIAAGFSPDDANTAAAIALAESSGHVHAIGDQSLAPSNGPSIGLWQINIGTRAHADLANEDLTDPQINANAAFAIFTAAGNSFSPWSTFGSGAYLRFLS